MQVTLQIDELSALLESAGPEFVCDSLNQLLSWSRPVPVAESSPEEMLCRVFQSAQATAFYTALADGLKPELGQYWLRADPVSLQAGMSRVFLAACGAPQLPTADRQQLQETLNQHFSEDGLEFFLPNNQRWYIRLAEGHSYANSEAAAGLFPSPRALLGKDISKATTATDKYWQQCFTELQMFLFAEPCNKQRENSGHTAITGLWLWGGGAVTALPVVATNLHSWGNSSLLQGLCQASDSPWHQAIKITAEGEHLIHWSTEQSGTAAEQLQLLDQQVFLPLCNAVTQGASAQLVVADAGCWHIRQRLRWPWRKSTNAWTMLVKNG
ncbi:MAG: hypothetical protein L3J24_01650 [Xanthomonadales bacterium]|nr:hypothetical protein [Xanthomonadales bacterium]